MASRGIHVKRLQFVVNYDFPTTLEQYCHRIGRTGRQQAGQVGVSAGESYSLITRNMAPLAKDLVALMLSCNQTPEPNLIALSTSLEADAPMRPEIFDDDENETGVDDVEDEEDDEDVDSSMSKIV